MIIIAEKVIFLPQFVGRRVLGGCAAVRGHHLGGDAVNLATSLRLFGGCAAVILAAALRLEGITWW